MADILIDTGPMVALFDPSERAHCQVVECLAGLTTRDRLHTSVAVITEATHLLDFSVTKQLECLRWCQLGGARIEPIDGADLPAIQALMEKYRDLPMDFADATLGPAGGPAGHAGNHDPGPHGFRRLSERQEASLSEPFVDSLM